MIALNDHYESIIRTNLIPMLIIRKILMWMTDR
jgi:hypothetical protein